MSRFASSNGSYPPRDTAISGRNQSAKGPQPNDGWFLNRQKILQGTGPGVRNYVATHRSRRWRTSANVLRQQPKIRKSPRWFVAPFLASTGGPLTTPRAPCRARGITKILTTMLSARSCCHLNAHPQESTFARHAQPKTLVIHRRNHNDQTATTHESLNHAIHPHACEFM